MKYWNISCIENKSDKIHTFNIQFLFVEEKTKKSYKYTYNRLNKSACNFISISNSSIIYSNICWIFALSIAVFNWWEIPKLHFVWQMHGINCIDIVIKCFTNTIDSFKEQIVISNKHYLTMWVFRCEGNFDTNLHMIFISSFYSLCITENKLFNNLFPFTFFCFDFIDFH